MKRFVSIVVSVALCLIVGILGKMGILGKYKIPIIPKVPISTQNTQRITHNYPKNYSFPIYTTSLLSPIFLVSLLRT